uniref:Ig-like domain-containing protein n=1 Tax=Hucho hucho TaxID=62062 RepID=A0A4W5NVD8_9TELE
MRRAKHVMEAVLCCVILLIIHRSSESIQVIGGSRTVVQGEDVDLFCSLLETDEELEQITWQKRTLEEPDNHNFLLIYPTGLTDFISSNGLDGRVQFLGNPKENIGSIRITAARLLDEGTFTCVFSVFPSGAYSIEIPLTVQDTSAACWVLLVIIFLIVVAAAGLIWYRWKNGKCLWSSFMGDQQFEVQSQVEEDEAGV